MYLAINGQEIAVYPIEFKVRVMDLDDGETTERTADGMLSRDRIAVKRQIEMGFNAMEWADLSALLSSMTDEFFELTYPDPLTGQQETKTFYVGDRDSGIAIYRNGKYIWSGVTMTLTEQ